MTDALPPIVVILLTYQRTDYMRRTVRAMREKLSYDGELVYYVADDGSDRAHMEAVAEELAGAKLLGYHTERRGYGYNATKAWYMALQYSDLSLWIEDDWECLGLDLTQYARTLMDHDDLGMIRFGYLPINLHTMSVGYDGYMYLRMDWGQHYAFSGNPALRHRRAREAWGPYPEGLKPGETEVAYDWQVNQAQGPAIVWPLAMGEWGRWAHIGAVRSYD